MLLNIGPDAKGNIPPESITILEEIAQWMSKNSESIYNCGYAHIEKPEYGRITKNGNILYYHVLENPMGVIPLTGLKHEQIKRIWNVATNAEIKISNAWNHHSHEDMVFISLGESPLLPDPVDTVIGVELME